MAGPNRSFSGDASSSPDAAYKDVVVVAAAAEEEAAEEEEVPSVGRPPPPPEFRLLYKSSCTPHRCGTLPPLLEAEEPRGDDVNESRW